MSIQFVQIIGQLPDRDPDPRCPRMKACTTEMWEALTEAEKQELIEEDLRYFRMWISSTQPINPTIRNLKF